MATFELKSQDGTTVRVKLTYNLISANDWEVVSGRSSILSAAHGTWTASTSGKRVILYDAANRQVAYFDHIGVAGVIGDPFKGMSVGDFGNGALLPLGAIQWTLIAK